MFAAPLPRSITSTSSFAFVECHPTLAPGSSLTDPPRIPLVCGGPFNTGQSPLAQSSAKVIGWRSVAPICAPTTDVIHVAAANVTAHIALRMACIVPLFWSLSASSRPQLTSSDKSSSKLARNSSARDLAHALHRHEHTPPYVDGRDVFRRDVILDRAPGKAEEASGFTDRHGLRCRLFDGRRRGLANAGLQPAQTSADLFADLSPQVPRDGFDDSPWRCLLVSPLSATARRYKVSKTSPWRRDI